MAISPKYDSRIEGRCIIGAIAAGVTAVAAVAGTAIQASSAGSAADKAAGASNNAAALEQHRYDVTRGDLFPYDVSGQQALQDYPGLYQDTADKLNSAYNDTQAHLPGQISQSMLENMPGYQFQLREGQKALANQLASKGLSGLSGTQVKSALNFGTGLASSNWQNLWNNQQQLFGDYSTQLANRSNIQTNLFNQLNSRAQLGENAAALTGNVGAQLGIQQGNNIANAGAFQGAGDLRAGNALASGLVGAAQAGKDYFTKNPLSGTDTYTPVNDGSGTYFSNSQGGGYAGV